jgi:NADH-quinone oxidoreductase subunit J
LISAIGILLVRNIIHAAYLLVLAFLAIAGIYVIAHAEFVAVTQIIIYTGGILVLLIFGIMLTSRLAGEKVLTGSGNRLQGAIIGIIFFMLITWGIYQVQFPGAGSGPRVTPSSGFSNIQEIGIRLMTDYVLVFELAGFLILIALVGASFMAKKDFGKTGNDTY